MIWQELKSYTEKQNNIMVNGIRLVIQNVRKFFVNVIIVVLWVMVQIVVIQDIKAIGLVVCLKFKMEYVHLIIWVFGMQSVYQFVLKSFAAAIIVVQVVLTRVQKLTGIVVIKKISNPNAQRLQKKSE